MLLVFGTKSTVAKKGERSEWCLACKNDKFEYIRIITWFSLFFIPIFPVHIAYKKYCISCGYTTKLSKKDFYAELAKENVLSESPFCESADEQTPFSQDNLGDTPFSENTGNGEALAPTREITVIREKKVSGSLMGLTCYVGTKAVGVVKNGKSVKFTIDNKEVGLYATMATSDGAICSNVILLKPTDTNSVFKVEIKKNTLLLQPVSGEASVQQ